MSLWDTKRCNLPTCQSDFDRMDVRTAPKYDDMAELAEQERIGAESIKKQKELRSAMANLLGVS